MCEKPVVSEPKTATAPVGKKRKNRPRMQLCVKTKLSVDPIIRLKLSSKFFCELLFNEKSCVDEMVFSKETFSQFLLHIKFHF